MCQVLPIPHPAFSPLFLLLHKDGSPLGVKLGPALANPEESSGTEAGVADTSRASTGCQTELKALLYVNPRNCMTP